MKIWFFCSIFIWKASSKFNSKVFYDVQSYVKVNGKLVKISKFDCKVVIKLKKERKAHLNLLETECEYSSKSKMLFSCFLLIYFNLLLTNLLYQIENQRLLDGY